MGRSMRFKHSCPRVVRVRRVLSSSKLVDLDVKATLFRARFSYHLLVVVVLGLLHKPVLERVLVVKMRVVVQCTL